MFEFNSQIVKNILKMKHVKSNEALIYATILMKLQDTMLNYKKSRAKGHTNLYESTSVVIWSFGGNRK